MDLQTLNQLVDHHGRQIANVIRKELTGGLWHGSLQMNFKDGKHRNSKMTIELYAKSRH